MEFKSKVQNLSRIVESAGLSRLEMEVICQTFGIGSEACSLAEISRSSGQSIQQLKHLQSEALRKLRRGPLILKLVPPRTDPRQCPEAPHVTPRDIPSQAEDNSTEKEVINRVLDHFQENAEEFAAHPENFLSALRFFGELLQTKVARERHSSTLRA